MGRFALVLHTHLPYLRRNGVWPCGEDFFHQAATESYLPVLGALSRLADRGLREGLTVGITPLVAHQMEDAHMLGEVAQYLGRYEPRALRQVANYRGIHERDLHDLAAFYALFARRESERLASLPGGIARGYGALEEAGAIEILGGPASHPYLPLVTEPALLRAQVAHGVAEHRRIFGRAPRGMWLPECAYRPGTDPPIEDVLERNGVGHVVVDGPTMLRSAGPGSTFGPRWIAGSAVAAFARNLEVTYKVWSPTGGYPADPWYRDFFHYDLEAGFKNWRVTNRRYALDRKRPYEPERGRARALRHAEEFVALLDRALGRHEAATGREGVVVACYDTELFGHWWFEGPVWLERVYELLMEHPRVRPASLERLAREMPPAERVVLEEGSWGFRKDHRSWEAPETQDMWEALAEVERETVRAATTLGAPGPPGGDRARAAALDQLVREAFLIQTSDWPFMVLRGRNPGYARERFFSHLWRWRRLAEALRRGAPPSVLAEEAAQIFEVDNAFPTLRATAVADAAAGVAARGG